MPRSYASVPPEAIRIEDEVWQEAFARREPARPRSRGRLHAIEGGYEADAPPARHGRAETPPARHRGADAPPARHRGAERPTAAVSQPDFTAPAPVLATPVPPPNPSLPRTGGVPGRRTVTIRGYGAERNLPWTDSTRRRPPQRAYERPGFKPDRVAMWAVMLGILLVIVAIASAHG